MSNIETWQINGYTLEYIDESHIYICDGVIIPSITQLLRKKFGGKYAKVPKDVLKRAADKGTALHRAIEDYCQTGEEADLKEVRNFKFLQKKYDFTVIGNEIPVILEWEPKKPICAGRLDLVLFMGGEVGIADIKRTSTLDKMYLGYQLNLYRLAYLHSYGTDVQFLKGVHLRDDVRKFVDIPINETVIKEFLKEVV